MLADAFSADTEHHPGNGLAILCLYNSSTAQVCQLLCVLKKLFCAELLRSAMDSIYSLTAQTSDINSKTFLELPELVMKECRVA